MSYRYTVVLERRPDGGYIASIPALEGCLTEGDTIEEALTMARDLIPLYVDTLRDLG